MMQQSFLVKDREEMVEGLTRQRGIKLSAKETNEILKRVDVKYNKSMEEDNIKKLINQWF